MNAYVSILTVVLVLSAYTAADGGRQRSQSRRWTAWVPRQREGRRANPRVRRMGVR